MQNVRNKCGSCALRTQDGVHCGVTGLEVDPNVDFCSRHNQSPQKCEICGRFIVGQSILDVIETAAHIVCPDCCSKFGTCQICDSARYCDFESNPIQIPPVVQRKVQQGPMIQVATVQNPERIKATCEKNCGCFDSEIGCLRQTSGCCGKFVHNYGG